MKPLRVAMLSYHTCPLATLGGKDTGGMNVYVRELTRQLGVMGVHVDVFTRSQDEHVPHIIHRLGYGNRVVHVPAGPELPLPKQALARYTEDFANYVVNFAEQKNIQYDLIHSHYWMSGIVGAKLMEMWQTPLVHMFHTLGLMKNRIAGHGEFEGDYRIRGELNVIRHANKIVAATSAEQAQLQWLYEVKSKQITIVPPGVDTHHFYPIPKDEAKEYIQSNNNKRMLLFVGRIEPLKGIETLIRAIGHLKDTGALERHEICLSIIGGDAAASEDEMSHEMGRLQKLRQDLGLSDFVTFLGKRSQEDLPYYYSAADMVIVPSHYESFGMVALEAMACGAPVIASQVGGLAYLIQDGVTGYHVPDQEPAELAERIVAILDNDELQQKLSKQAAKHARQYSWENIAEQIVEIYYSVVSKPSNSPRNGYN